MIEIPAEVHAALQALLDYTQPDEEHDAQINGEPEGHVIHAIRAVRAWMDADVWVADDPGVMQERAQRAARGTVGWDGQA